MTARVDLEGVSKSFQAPGGAKDVANVAFTASSGEVVALVAHSGCGKSMLR